MPLSFWTAALALAGGASVQLFILLITHLAKEFERWRIKKMIMDATKYNIDAATMDDDGVPIYTKISDLPAGEYEIFSKGKE